VPDDNVPDDNVPDDNVPDDNVPDDNVPDDNVPDTKVNCMNSKLMQRSRARRAGFSLAELMVVIVIIGLLATQVVPRLMDSFGTAQLQKTKADITAMDNAVTEFVTNNMGRYPTSLEDLITKDQNGRTYLGRETVPKDPWGFEFVYYPPSGGTENHEILSYGADGSQGGDGKNKDILLSDIKNQRI